MKSIKFLLLNLSKLKETHIIVDIIFVQGVKTLGLE